MKAELQVLPKKWKRARVGEAGQREDLQDPGQWKELLWERKERSYNAEKKHDKHSYRSNEESKWEARQENG